MAHDGQTMNLAVDAAAAALADCNLKQVIELKTEPHSERQQKQTNKQNSGTNSHLVIKPNQITLSSPYQFHTT